MQNPRMKASKVGFGIALLAISQPAAAERVQTYWRLEPLDAQPPTSAAYETPFFAQRLLPLRLVRLTEAVTVGRRTLPTGTFLYLVFNADRRVGYCTIKDRSPGNLARTLFIPILDQRPCLVDSNNDGRFESSFSVYDKWGGPPSVRGSINNAQPIGATAAYEVVDVREFPVDMRMSLEFRGSRADPARARIRVSFSEPIGGEWHEVRGASFAGGTLFQLGNVNVILRSVAEGQASFELAWTPNFAISSDTRSNLYWNPIPEFLAEN